MTVSYPPFHVCATFSEHIKHRNWVLSGDIRHPQIKKDIATLRRKKRAAARLGTPYKKPSFNYRQLPIKNIGDANVSW